MTNGYDSFFRYVIPPQDVIFASNSDLLRFLKAIPAIFLICLSVDSSAQEVDRSWGVSLFSGMINYQGDLNPNSFTFKNSNIAAGVIIRKPISRWFTLRGGINIGKIESADARNRDYLKARNLSFHNSIEEVYAALEITLLDASKFKFTPYMFAGFGMFHADPWTYDNSGVKTFLRPLSTEGQGLPQYPKQRPYTTIQPVLPFGGGARYAVSDAFIIGVEFHQRKTFFDYIDDVSSHFVDHDVLLAAKGPKAIELSYRGDEVPGGSQVYPSHGEQRGTPTEMDWYYFLGITLELKLNMLSGMFSNLKGSNDGYYRRCPKVPMY